MVTIYDFTHEKFVEQIRHAERQVKWKSQAIKKADGIICISRSTFEDLKKYHPGAESKATVIYLSDELQDVEADVVEVGDWVESEFLLFVGGRNDYKNFDGLLEAFKILGTQHESLHLICVGAPFGASESEKIKSFGLEQRVHCAGRVSDKGLKALYERCAAFVFPSLYEGFGIPLLEAMGCGAPIVAAEHSCFKEISDGSAWLVDATVAESLARGIERVLTDVSLREKLILRGRQRIKDFSWQRTAEQTEEFYRRQLQGCRDRS